MESFSAEILTDITLSICREGLGVLKTCALYGISCEGWLQVMMIKELTKKLLGCDGYEIKPEFEKIDIVIITPNKRYLLELKTFPTNYGRSGKPITQFINSVIDDLKKLAQKREGADTGVCIWLAYRIPSPEPANWGIHLKKIENAARRTITHETFRLWGSIDAHLYVMESL